MKRVLIMAGGTGGHIMPALAVAELLQSQDIEVHWLGNQHSLEDKLVSAAHIPMHYISITGIHGRGLKHWLAAPFKILAAIVKAMRIIQQLRPCAVIGFGGYVAGPGGVSAWLLRKPLIIHEQNSIPGLTNRWLARLAKFTLQGFADAFPPNYHAITTGNPVRYDIANLPMPALRFAERQGNLRVLILGGSKGLRTFNQIVPQAFAKLAAEQRPQIWHAAGQQYVASTQALYQALAIDAKVEGFIDNMAEAYAWADLAICCGGASTITELTAAGIGSILVPYPLAVDDHQTRNCQHLVRANAAILIPQTQLTAEQLAQLLAELTADRNRLLTMAAAARNLYQANAAQAIANYCLQCCNTN